MTRTLVPITGGRDTAFIAYELLKETNEEVIGMRFSFKGFYVPEEFNRASDFAAQQIVNWLRENVRDLEFEQYVMNLDRFTEHNWFHGAEYALVAARMCNENKIDRAVAGWLSEQNRPGRGAHSKLISKAVFEAQAKRGTFEFPLENRSKAHVIAGLPSDLEELCMTCKTPVFNEDGHPFECDDCPYCNRVNEIHERLHAGETVEQIHADLLTRGGSNQQTKPWTRIKDPLFVEWLKSIGVSDQNLERINEGLE